MLERRAIRALGRSAATGCAGSAATVAPALAAAGLPALSPPARAMSTASGSGARLRAAHGSRSPRRRGGANLAVTPSGAHTERAQAGASFPSALITSLLGLLLAIAMVVVPKLRHRAAPVPDVASGTGTLPPPQNEMAARTLRAQVIPMDSAIAPMAADAFSRMAHDADQAIDPENEPRGEHEPEDRGDTTAT
jgi:hypothetical protein